MSSVTLDLYMTVMDEHRAGRKCFAICVAPEKRVQAHAEMQDVMIIRCQRDADRTLRPFTTINVSTAQIGSIVPTSPLTRAF